VDSLVLLKERAFTACQHSLFATITLRQTYSPWTQATTPSSTSKTAAHAYQI